MSCIRFERKQPCNNCPYRKDAPLAYWSIQEFINLIEHDKQEFGGVFQCHKKDDHVCVGWLMDQDKRGLPSIALRIRLMHDKVTREYLDSLRSPSKLYKGIKEMCIANFPILRKYFVK